MRKKNHRHVKYRKDLMKRKTVVTEHGRVHTRTHKHTICSRTNTRIHTTNKHA